MIILTRYFSEPAEVSESVGVGRDGGKYAIRLAPAEGDGQHIDIEFLGKDTLRAFLEQLNSMAEVVLRD